MAVEEEMDDYADIDFIDDEEEEEAEEEEGEEEEEVEEEEEEVSEEIDAEIDAEIDGGGELETMEELEMSSTGSTDVKSNQSDKAPAVKIISNRLTRVMAKEGINGAKLIHFSNEVSTSFINFTNFIRVNSDWIDWFSDFFFKDQIQYQLIREVEFAELHPQILTRNTKILTHFVKFVQILI